MKNFEQYLDQELAPLLRPGEQVILRGLGIDGQSWLVSVFLWGRARRYYGVALTNQRFITVKVKSKIHYRLGLPPWEYGPAPIKVETLSFELGDVAEIIVGNPGRESVLYMLFKQLYGLESVGIVPRAKAKGLTFFMKRTQKRHMPTYQGAFYRGIIDEARGRIRGLPARVS